MINKIEKKDWTLLVIAEADKVGLTPVKLQKSLFLLKNNLPREAKNFYNFIPYNYGPFDIGIYHDADILKEEGYIETPSAYGSGRKYNITKRGKQRAEEIHGLLTEEANKYIKRLIDWILPLSFQELVASVYKEFPEYKKNSVFRD
jgi:hypothetical protein